MNASLVPEYILPDVLPLSYIVSAGINIIAIIPNIYFVIRTITYKSFKNRLTFYWMTLIMSIEYTIGICSHLSLVFYFFYYYLTKNLFYLDTCSKMEAIDFDFRYIINVTPLYFTVSRYYTTIKQKSVNSMVLMIIISLTMIPLIYNTIIKFLGIKKLYTQYIICEYQIISSVQFYEIFQIFTNFQILFVPFITIIINYIIYIYIKKKKIKSNNVNANKEHKILFKSLTIQVFFPYLCQFPGFIYFFYFKYTKKKQQYFEAISVFIYHIGEASCTFLSLYVIKEFKKMMANDFYLIKYKLFLFINSNKKESSNLKTVTSAKSTRNN
uniref:G-protein coupled receptors family 1 profile domain-containing protein n=1 Tax=Strongyloides stercoralis TaxID=6248 RepID=A0A0K0EL55_STRER